MVKPSPVHDKQIHPLCPYESAMVERFEETNANLGNRFQIQNFGPVFKFAVSSTHFGHLSNLRP